MCKAELAWITQICRMFSKYRCSATARLSRGGNDPLGLVVVATPASLVERQEVPRVCYVRHIGEKVCVYGEFRDQKQEANEQADNHVKMQISLMIIPRLLA